MTKTLIKKQMLEVFAWIYQDKRTGKNRDKKGVISYSLLYIMIFGFLAMIFYKLSDFLCAPLVGAGFGWMYMAMMGLVGVALGVFGSVFNTFASLYQAKDNDLLLAMPISVRSVLIARLSGVYAMGLMYELVVMIPAVVVYFIVAKMNLLGTIFSLLIPLVLSFLVLILSCILGWIVALINSRLNNQKILTVIVSLAFIGGYYYLCGSAGDFLQSVILNPENVAGKVRGIVYPLYHMGLAAEGNVLSMLIFTLIIMILSGVVYLVMQHSFLKLATINKGVSKIKYVEKKVQTVSAGQALLRKEFCRFFQSPNYMLNCGLGIVFMPFAAVMLFVRQDMVKDMIFVEFADYKDVVMLFAVAAICMMATMNDMVAPSVSLEGKNLWLIKVLPVSGWQVLKAKLGLQFVLNIIPAVILTVCVEWILRPELLFVIMIPLTVFLFIVLMDAFGLICNLKAPNLSWTSEIIPIKQSLSVMLALFGGWVIVFLFAVSYYLLREHITVVLFLVCVDMVLLVFDIILLIWLKKRGSMILEILEN